jgi:hypothetical protein
MPTWAVAAEESVKEGVTWVDYPYGRWVANEDIEDFPAIVINVGEARRTEGFWECNCPCQDCVMSGPHEDHEHEGTPGIWTQPGMASWPFR